MNVQENLAWGSSIIDDFKKQAYEDRVLIILVLLVMVGFLYAIFVFLREINALPFNPFFWEWDWESIGKSMVLPLLIILLIALILIPLVSFLYYGLSIQGKSEQDLIGYAIIASLLGISVWFVVYLILSNVGLGWVFEPWTWKWEGTGNKLMIPIVSLIVISVFFGLGSYLLYWCVENKLLSADTIVNKLIEFTPIILIGLVFYVIWLVSKFRNMNELNDFIEFWRWDWKNEWPRITYSMIAIILLVWISYSMFTSKNNINIGKNFYEYSKTMALYIKPIFNILKTYLKNSAEALLYIGIFSLIYCGVYLMMKNFGGPYGYLEFWNSDIWNNFKFWESEYWNKFIIKDRMSSTTLFILLILFIALSLNTGLSKMPGFVALVIIMALSIGYIGIINTYNTNIDGMMNRRKKQRAEYKQRRINRKKVEKLKEKMGDLPINNKFNVNNYTGKIQGAPLKFNNKVESARRINQIKAEYLKFKKQHIRSKN